MGTTVITINVTSDQASPSQETTVIDACGLTPSLRSRSSLGSLRDLLDISADICDASPFSVAQGGYADLHTATYLGNKVALKLLRILNAPDEAKKRFRREAHVWLEVRHNNVLPFLGICYLGPHICMASPWQENGHVIDYLKTHPQANRLLLLTQVVDALSYMHGRDPQIIHGDIKGLNVLISNEGNALLCDFGLSKMISDMATMSGTPTELFGAGTIRWMAPELFSDEHGDGSKTSASDIYAFAMLIVEMYSGTMPFAEVRSTASVMRMVLEHKRPARPLPSPDANPPEGMPNAIWRLVEVCWVESAKSRPSAVLVRELLECLAQKEVSVLPRTLGRDARSASTIPFAPLQKETSLESRPMWSMADDLSVKGPAHISSYVLGVTTQHPTQPEPPKSFNSHPGFSDSKTISSPRPSFTQLPYVDDGMLPPPYSMKDTKNAPRSLRNSTVKYYQSFSLYSIRFLLSLTTCVMALYITAQPQQEFHHPTRMPIIIAAAISGVSCIDSLYALFALILSSHRPQKSNPNIVHTVLGLLRLVWLVMWVLVGVSLMATVPQKAQCSAQDEPFCRLIGALQIFAWVNVVGCALHIFKDLPQVSAFSRRAVVLDKDAHKSLVDYAFVAMIQQPALPLPVQSKH